MTDKERARLIGLVRQRAAAAGTDIGHMTDEQVSHWPDCQWYLFPEFIDSMRGAFESVLRDAERTSAEIHSFEATLPRGFTFPRDSWWRRALGVGRW